MGGKTTRVDVRAHKRDVNMRTLHSAFRACGTRAAREYTHAMDERASERRSDRRENNRKQQKATQSSSRTQHSPTSSVAPEEKHGAAVEDDQRDRGQVRLRGHHLGREGHGQVQRHPAQEEQVVGVLAAQHVGERGPANASNDRHDGDADDEIRGEGLVDDVREVRTVDLLDHGGGAADDADPGRDVAAEGRPQQPELRRLQGRIDVHVRGEADGLGGLRRRPTGGHPAVLRNLERQRGGHHDGGVDATQRQEGLRRAGAARADQVHALLQHVPDRGGGDVLRVGDDHLAHAAAVLEGYTGRKCEQV